MERDLAAASGVLPPAHLPLVRHRRRRRLHRAHRTARRDQPGAALKLEARFYNKLVDHFHSPAVPGLDRLAALWTRTVLRLFPQPLRINGRCIVVGDGIKVPKRGRKMPGVKLLHQQSKSNTKPGIHHGTLPPGSEPARAGRRSVFAVPLAIRIHEGVVWSNRDRRTLLDKMLALLGIVAIAEPCYFIANTYYAARKIVTGLLKENNHLLTRVKSNAVAYTAHQQRGPRKRPAQSLWPQGQAEIPVG